MFLFFDSNPSSKTRVHQLVEKKHDQNEGGQFCSVLNSHSFFGTSKWVNELILLRMNISLMIFLVLRWEMLALRG